MPSLTDRLLDAAQAWCDSGEKLSLARLGRAVVNDTAFFVWLERSPKGPSTSTLEKFAAFFADPGNWPQAGGHPGETEASAAHHDAVALPAAVECEGPIPEAVLSFCHAVGVSAPQAPRSPDSDGDPIDTPKSGADVSLPCESASGDLFADQLQAGGGA